MTVPNDGITLPPDDTVLPRPGLAPGDSTLPPAEPEPPLEPPRPGPVPGPPTPTPPIPGPGTDPAPAPPGRPEPTF
ncbi:hypothetical protein GCM10022223_40950 [Kineosporia mesophila]|uniref:Uncharacterized protein n=1 Tax=Kineosporia mesophila TaxID=566012 RepID=A0ABP6ZV20_9ACTN|nr:hypothetical protein [Kineosporia mesophila]MCD5348710.1 hypothetical protein [Kineosporia mesophila]